MERRNEKKQEDEMGKRERKKPERENSVNVVFLFNGAVDTYSISAVMQPRGLMYQRDIAIQRPHLQECNIWLFGGKLKHDEIKITIVGAKFCSVNVGHIYVPS